MPSSKKKFIAAGLLAAGSAAAVTAYAVRRRRDKAVDKELAGLLDEADAQPAGKPSPTVETSALGRARVDLKDLQGAKPVVEAKSGPAIQA
jgi:hypothetical protein